jgi:hypothetical protein
MWVRGASSLVWNSCSVLKIISIAKLRIFEVEFRLIYRSRKREFIIFISCCLCHANWIFLGCSYCSGFYLLYPENTLFISLVVYLTTGPKPLPKPALHILRSRASSFRCEYPLPSLRSSSSFLRLLPRLPVTSIPTFIFPSIISCRSLQVYKEHVTPWR